MREAFALVFNKKYWYISAIHIWNFNETLTNDVVSFEQPCPDVIIMTWNLAWEMQKVEFAKRVDHNEPPQLDLLCLPFVLWILSMIYSLDKTFFEILQFKI